MMEQNGIIFINAQGSQGSQASENMLIIASGTGEEQEFLIILPPSLTPGGGNNVPQIRPMVLRL